MNTAANAGGKATRARYFILFLVCVVTCLNYLERANLAVAAPFVRQELGLNPAMLGLVFSAFGWTYACMQIPSGWLLDRWGPRLIYTVALVGWSLSTAAVAFAKGLAMLIGMRMAVGFFESPAFPANGRIVTAWFPAKERGLAIGAYTGSEFIGLALLTPLISWLMVTFGWRSVFVITGTIGVIIGLLWHRSYRDPRDYPQVNEAELAYIRQGGGFADRVEERRKASWDEVLSLFRHRQLWGMYIGIFASTATLYFFMTWFPSYLVVAKKMTLLRAGFYAAGPFLGAICGVLAGGRWSDWMLARGYSLAVARKLPIITGLLMSGTIVAANYTADVNLVIAIMAAALFGQGMAATVAWALLSEIAPRELMGITGGVFNFAANLGGVITPLIIGFVLNMTDSFEAALIFIAAVCFTGALSYIFLVGKPCRLEVHAKAIPS